MNKENNMFKEIFSGGISLTIATLVVKALGLIYKVPLAGILGEEGMGYFNSAYTIYSFFYIICTAGVPKAVMILISGYRAEKKDDQARLLLSISMKLFTIVGIIVFLILCVFSSPLSKLIGNSKSTAALIAVAPSIVFVSLASVIRGYLSSELKLIEIAVSQIIEGVGKLVVGLVAAHIAFSIGLPLHIISAMTILGVSFGSVAGLIHLLVIAKVKIIKVNIWQNKLIGEILRISLPITLSATIMSLTNVIDLGLIMNSLQFIGYTEEEAGALYGNYTTMAVPMLNFAIAIISPIAMSFIPLYTKAIRSNDLKSLAENIESSNKLTSFIVAPISIGLLVYAKDILNFLFPEGNCELGAHLLRLLIPAIIFSAELLLVNNLLESAGCVHAPLVSMGVGCIVKIALSLLLIRNPAFAISGAPIGTSISYAVAVLVSIILLKLEINSRINVFLSYSRYILSALAAVCISKLIHNSIKPFIRPNISLLFAISACALIYFGLVAIHDMICCFKTNRVAKYTKSTSLNCNLNT